MAAYQTSELARALKACEGIATAERAVHLEYQGGELILTASTVPAPVTKSGTPTYTGEAQVQTIIGEHKESDDPDPEGLALDIKYDDLREALRALWTGKHEWFRVEQAAVTPWGITVLQQLRLTAGADPDSLTLGLQAVAAEEDSRHVPLVAQPKVIGTLTVPRLALLDALARCGLYVSRDQTRPIITAVFVKLDRENQRLDVVSTDTYALVRHYVPCEASPRFGSSWLLPSAWCAAVCRGLRRSDEEAVELIVTADSVRLPLGDAGYACCPLEGEYINYGKVIKDQPNEFRAEVGPWLAALRMVEMVAREDADRVLIKADGQRLRVSAQSEAYEAETSFPVADGEPVPEIAMNGRMLAKFLSSVDREAVVAVRYEGPLNNFTISFGDVTYLQMPMQIM